jgi:hypothetical protein
VSIGQRRLTEMTCAESLRLLGSVSLGRIVFTQRALPVIRPVNHVIDGGDIIIRTHSRAAVLSVAEAARGMVVVAYEADAIDAEDHLGWSVIVTGTASLVHDPHAVARYQRMLQPWAAGQMDQVIRIHPQIITGFRLDGIRDAGLAAGSS